MVYPLTRYPHAMPLIPLWVLGQLTVLFSYVRASHHLPHLCLHLARLPRLFWHSSRLEEQLRRVLCV